MNPERRDALWQEMMALTAPVSEISPFRTRPLATLSSTTSAKRTAIGTPTLSPSAPAWNVHFKKPTASYTDLFAQLETAGTISTRGLKPDATHYCELVFDVNSAYFDNHGGYEFAKQFYEDAYKAAVQIVGGEQYILSAVMHADEINRAMTEALGREVYHYHLHVVYVPVVEKQILWSKRCKDKALVGTVKETVMQVSRSKKWASKPLLDDAGKPVLQKNGKPVLKKSYSILQDDFFNYMRNAGYTDVERGERGSTEEHLTVTQFKVQREQERLDTLTAQADQKEQQSLAKTSQNPLPKARRNLPLCRKRPRSRKKPSFMRAIWIISVSAPFSATIR